MAINWAERLDNIKNNVKSDMESTSTNRWATILDQGRANQKFQGLQIKLSDFENSKSGFEKSANSFASGWQDEKSTNNFYSSFGNFYAEAEAIRQDLEENAAAYKSILGDEKYKTIYDSFNAVSKNKDSELEGFKRRGDLYSKYKTADEYNKAYRTSQIGSKYDNIKTFEDYNKYIKSGNFEQADMPKDEKDYLLRLGYALEYQETLSNLNAMKKRLEGLPKEFTANKTYNPQEIAENQTERKQLESGIKRAEARIKEMDNMGGVYTGLNTQITSESGEYAFDQRWSAAKKEMEDFLELTPSEKRRKMSGQKVEGKEIVIDDFLKKAKSEEYTNNYLHYLTEDEQKLYSYIKQTDGEKAAQIYLEELKVAKLDKRLNQALFQKMSDFASKSELPSLLANALPGGAIISQLLPKTGNAEIASLASVPMSVFSGLEFAAYRLGGEKFDGIRSTLATQSQGFREGTKSHWDGAWGEQVWDFLYDTGMSGVDSAAAAGLSAAVPFLGEALLGGSAAASTYNDALDRGISHGDAMLTALTAGVAESLFEHMSISKFLDAGDITKGFTKAGLRQAGKNILIEMGINASEEALTEVSNIITDTLINGNLSNYAIAVKDYYMQGMTPEEAKKTALADFGKQIVEAGASGALMGFGFGSISSIKGMAHSQVLNSRNGGLVKLSGNLAELKTVAELSNNEEIKAAAEKLTETSKPSEIGYVYNSLVADAVEQSVSEMTPVLLENGAKESGSNSAKGWATQIANSLFDKNEGKKAELSINKVTSEVYSDFTTEGKYGGDKLLNLKNIISTPYLNQKTTASEVGTVLNENGIEAPVAADGSGAAIGSVMGDTVKGIAAAPRSGEIRTITDAYRQNVANNLEKQRPNPKAMSEKQFMKTYFADKVQISPEEEKILKEFGKANGLDVEFVDGAVNGKGYGVFQNGKQIVISRYAKKPMAALFKHEFTHSTEKAKGYDKFQDYVFEESEAFKGWINAKGFADWKELSNNIVRNYEESGVDYEDPYIKAKADIIADFVGDVLFGEVIDAKGNPIKLDTNFLVELKKNDRNLFQRFVEWVHSILKRLTTKGVVNKDIIKLEQKFKRLAEQARQQRAKGESEQSEGEYSLPELDTEYMKAVESGDMETAQRLVDEAAKKAGYTQKLYHGTNKFGFTKIDVSNSDDGISFFATDTEETAETYSSGVKRKRISDASESLPDGDAEEIQDEIKSLTSRLSEWCNRNLGIQGWVDYDYFKSKLEDCFYELEIGTPVDSVISNFDGFCDELYFSFADNYYQENYEDNPYLDEEDYLSWEDWQESKEANDLSDEYWNNVAQIIAKFKALDTSANSGVYDLYANTEGMLVVDAKGENWNRLPDPRDADGKLGLSGEFNFRMFTTRDYARYGKAEGYRGVIFKNIKDSGDGSYVKPTTVYIFFNPQEQVKSADPVTYDDKGKVIPLSQRFNPENDDIRYSLPDLDSSGQKLSEGQIEYFKDSLARDEYGNLLVLYHGTPNGGFFVFDPEDSYGKKPTFLTNNIQTANSYIDEGKNHNKFIETSKKPEALRWLEGDTTKPKGKKGLYKVYANVTNPLIVDCKGGFWNNIPFGENEVYKVSYANGEVTIEELNSEETKTVTFTERQIAERTTVIAYFERLFNKEMAEDFSKQMKGATKKSATNGMVLGNFTWDSNRKRLALPQTTNSITRMAKKQGYDGVIFKNIHDHATGGNPENFDLVGQGDTVVAVFDSNQIKDVNNTNPTKDKDIRYSLPDDGYTPTFYSKMGKTVDEMKQDKIGANSVISYLKGRGVKDEEIKWSGIETFLEGKKSVTKQELLDFINASSLEIGEQIGTENAINDVRDAINSLYYTVEREFPYCLDFSSTSEFIEGIAYELERDRRVLTSVYDEIEAYILDAMFTHFEPTDEYSEFYEWQDSEDGQKIYAAIDDTVNTIGVYAGVIQNTSGSRQSRWQDYTLDGGTNYRELVFTMPGSTYSNQAMKAHWGQDAEGVLAHARIQDFNVDGKKMLFIEEIQSDWHNEGHKSGYESEEYTKAAREEEKIRNELSGLAVELRKANDNPEETNLREKKKELEKKLRDVILKRKTLGVVDAVPDAPFRDNYHEFVLKRLLRMAAEEGYDSIGWTPADVQSERWSDEFAEGYRIEYDQDIPKFLKKYGKQWGATVGSTVLNNGTEVWSMDITDQMKNSVLYEGQALYSLPDDSYNIPEIARGKTAPELWEMSQKGEITSDDALKVLAEQHGTMPKGENPKVDVDVPNKVSDTKGVRRFARTALESGHLTEGMSEDAKREIINGALNYEISSNKMVTNIAEKKVAKNINKAIQEWEGLMASGKIPTAEDIALGEVLLVEAAKAGNANDVAMYLAEIAALGTQLGQGIQALSLLKKLTGVGQLHYVSRVIAQMNEDLKRRYGDKFQDVLSIDPNLEEILAKSKNQAEIEEVIDDILTDVAKQMPSTWLDKFNAWRYLAMLGNTRTHIRNFFGNAIFLPAIRIKDALGTIGERMFIKDASHRTKVFKVNKKYREYAMKDFEEVKGLLTRGGKMNPSDIVQDRRKIFTSKLFAPVEKFRKFNFDMLEKEDLIFLKKHYIHALGSVLQSRGLDVNNITEQQLKDARDYAINEAQKATYRDFSFFANMLNKLAHPTKNGKPVRDVATKGLAVLIEGALPFKKTPINILKRGIEYSPLGIATTFGNAIIAGRRGEFSGAEFIDGITSGMTGTMILGLGMLLQSMGWLVGGLGYDDEDAFERLSGAQPYAIDFGDWSYTIDWMAPSSLPLLIGAEISKALDKEEGQISDLLLAIAEPMTELSFLQGVNDIIEGVAYSGENGLGVTGEVVTNLASTYVSQYFPTLTGQVARTFDDTRRANFVDKSSAVPKTLQKTAQKILGKIPFAENQKIPYIDAWGRTEENGNVLLRVFENFVSPGYVSKIEDDKVNNELAKVYTNTGESGVIPKKAGTSFSVNGKMVYLDAEKYVQYATDKGQYSRRYLEEIMSSDLYNGLSSDGKAEAIAFLFSYANAKAKSNVSDYDYREISTYKTAAKLEDAGISPASYAVAKFAMSKENADTDGSDSVSKSEKRKALRNAGFSSRDANKILNINKK